MSRTSLTSHERIDGLEDSISEIKDQLEKVLRRETKGDGGDGDGEQDNGASRTCADPHEDPPAAAANGSVPEDVVIPVFQGSPRIRVYSGEFEEGETSKEWRIIKGFDALDTEAI